MKQMITRATRWVALLCLNLTLVAGVRAQQATTAALGQAGQTGSGQPPTGVAATSGQPSVAAVSAGLPNEMIEKLVAPIALYPDVLVSQILPASTFPVDIVKAARWLRSKPDLSTLAKQEWDLSVLSLCHYPDVIYKMDQDLDWTGALGATFMAQPSDVMNAIQRLRLLAQGNGALKTTEQQTVVVEKETIRIVPAQPQVIYVPTYNPQTVYVIHDDDDDDDDAAAVAAAAVIGFGVGLAMGTWLDNDCDWYGGAVVYCRPGYWGGYGYRGAVAWNDNWAAAVGPRRAAVVGEHGGAYVGPRGAAVWNDNGHGAAWRRPTPYGAPTYGGRYSSYNSYARNTAYRGNTAIGNDITVNRNNVNVDRGDRDTAVRGGNSTAVGGDRTQIGQTGRPGSTTPGNTSARPTPYSSGFSERSGSLNSATASNRGQQSRQTSTPRTPARSPTAAQRPSTGSTSGARSTYTPSARPTTGSPSRQSSFSNYSGSGQTRSYSSRGSSSRSSAGMSRGGGGARGGGGRGRR